MFHTDSFLYRIQHPEPQYHHIRIQLSLRDTFKMVHLSTIPKDDAIKEGLDLPLTPALKKVHLQLANDEDRFTTSVYGSKFAAADLPRHEMPEDEMPKEVAYRMIKDELSLDGNPMLK